MEMVDHHEEEPQPIDYYNVEILRICCKGTNQSRISDFQHLIRYETKALTVNDAQRDLKVVSFLNLSPKANNTNDEHLRSNDSRIKDDKVSIYAYTTGWVLNSQIISCMRCDMHFGVTSWRHHCRLCGYLVCNKCSAFVVGIFVNIIEPKATRRVLLEKHGSRVCNHCYEHKGGPDAIDYVSNPLSVDVNPLRPPSLTGSGLAGEGDRGPIRRPSANNMDSLVTPARRSFSTTTNPLVRQGSFSGAAAGGAMRRSSAPGVPGEVGGNGRASRSPSISPSTSQRNLNESVPPPVPTRYVAGSYENTISRANIANSAGAMGVADVRSPTAPGAPADRSPALDRKGSEVDKEKKAKMIQKFQEAKEAETKANQERVQTIKRDPSRLVNNSNQTNLFVLKDKSKKGEEKEAKTTGSGSAAAAAFPAVEAEVTPAVQDVAPVVEAASEPQSDVPPVVASAADAAAPVEDPLPADQAPASPVGAVFAVNILSASLDTPLEAHVDPVPASEHVDQVPASVTVVVEEQPAASVPDLAQDEDVHAFSDNDVAFQEQPQPQTPHTPARTPGGPSVWNTVQTAQTAQSDAGFSYVSDLTPMNMRTIGTPEVQYTTKHGVWEAESAQSTPFTPLDVDNNASMMSMDDFVMDPISPLAGLAELAERKHSGFASGSNHRLVTVTCIDEGEHEVPSDDASTPATPYSSAPNLLAEDDGGFFESPFEVSTMDLQCAVDVVLETEEGQVKQ